MIKKKLIKQDIKCHCLPTQSCRLLIYSLSSRSIVTSQTLHRGLDSTGFSLFIARPEHVMFFLKWEIKFQQHWLHWCDNWKPQQQNVPFSVVFFLVSDRGCGLGITHRNTRKNQLTERQVGRWWPPTRELFKQRTKPDWRCSDCPASFLPACSSLLYPQK